MKMLRFAGLAALTLLGSMSAIQAQEATTSPVGYVTQTLKSGQFNLVGLTLHNPIAVSGALDSVSDSAVTDADVDFTSILTSGATYILEITENPADTSLVGTIQEVTSWSATTLDTPQDLASDGLAAGAKYQLREATSLQDVFGPSPALKSGSSAITSDIVWLPNGIGGYNKYYFQTQPIFLGGATSWRNAETNTEITSDIPIVYTDGFYVEVQASSPDFDLVTSGSVKISAVGIALTNGFNLVSSIYPAGSTLQNSGLSSSLASGSSVITSDVVWLDNGSGGYNKYYFQTQPIFLGGATSWRNADTNAKITSEVSLPSAYYIQRLTTNTDFNATPPDTYSSL